MLLTFLYIFILSNDFILSVDCLLCAGKVDTKRHFMTFFLAMLAVVWTVNRVLISGIAPFKVKGDSSLSVYNPD